MGNRPWKVEERRAAELLGGRRYPANQGGFTDVESETYVAQVKHRQRLSLAELEALALEAERVGEQKNKIGVVIVKRRFGKGRPTPRLVVMTEVMWRAMSGPLPRGPRERHQVPG